MSIVQPHPRGLSRPGWLEPAYVHRVEITGPSGVISVSTQAPWPNVWQFHAEVAPISAMREWRPQVLLHPNIEITLYAQQIESGAWAFLGIHQIGNLPLLVGGLFSAIRVDQVGLGADAVLIATLSGEVPR